MARKVKVMVTGLSLLAVVLVSANYLVHSGNAASAVESSCIAKGVVSNSPDGNGVVFTVTTTGLCKDTPLVLTSVDSIGAKTVLASLPFTSNDKGEKVASVSFVPEKQVASYVVNVENAFTATVNP